MSSSSPTESPPSPPSDSSNSPPSPPSNSSKSPPPSDSSSPSTPPPSDSSSSPPPPSPPSDSSSSSPPPSPPSDSSSSPSPPTDSNSKSSPPPSENKSPSPPPSEKNSPPSDQNSNSPPSNGGNNNNNNNNRSPPPPRSPPLSTQPSPPSRSGSPLLPSSNRSPPSSNSQSNDDSSNNTTAIVAGAAIGAGLLFLIFIVILVSCCRRKKKRKPHDQMKYYRDSRGNMSSDYYNSGPRGNWQNGAPNDHMLKIPPQQGGAGANSEQNWSVPAPPPPPRMSSSELSSADYSGGAPLPPPHPAVALGFNQSSFTYDELAAATGGFAKANLLGQGGFGYVHKGVLPNGKEIAVKSLKSNSGQGEREFQAEVDIISRVHHRHLVSLVGYCIAGSKRLLVYEYVPNGTLEYHLHGHPRIIHRDIKAANILLESNFEAKVADFGLAKLSSDNHTHVSTRIMGTFGYLAPEYASSGKLTEKSDVYSFGIMLLELITGRRPIDISSDDDGLVDWARPILIRFTDGGSYEELVDPRLENNYDPQEMVRMIASAAACIRQSAKRRPKMSKIVRALEGDVSLDDLNEGMKLGHSTLLSSASASEYDLTRLRKAAQLSSQEFNSSSEHGSTGEFARSNGANSQEITPNPGSHFPDV
ncbi:hypothetical protein BUALT_Bualt15G0025700 [Buddleja alternifolia]|uniref:non-specific serine/threonine protein kinase n=1 Tax=Buddleja alternifolia TaxID=168488 RepID=A0AAV6WC46_9LAMI|nr:hypothetical protein BUALT_Bualt15G0025700 [Buddleja alternifolia]